jgi:hypothetical protein
MKTLNTSRRNLLRSAAGLAGGLAMARREGPAAQEALPAPLPTVKLGRHETSRLIIGANPFGGYSHFNKLLDDHMREWMTEDRVVETLRRCEQSGINTWQFHYSPQTLAALKRHRQEGGKLQFIVLSEGELKRNLDLIPEVAKLKPVAIVHHGGVTDERFRAREMHKVEDYLKRVRDTGVMVGLSMHNPHVMEYVEEKGWDIDLYMTCFYRISRTPEESRQACGGKLPLGEVFLEDDPAEMTKRVRQTRKPCLGFKILAAGRSINSPEQVEKAFQFAFSNIKASDAVIVGMYPRYKDEVKENSDLTRRFGGRES